MVTLLAGTSAVLVTKAIQPEIVSIKPGERPGGMKAWLP